MQKLLVITRGGQRLVELADKLKGSETILHQEKLGHSISAIESNGVDTILVDINSLLHTHLPIDEALEQLWNTHPSASVIVVAKSDQSHHAVKAVKAGAFDYLTHPVEKEELELVIEKAHEADVRDSELDYLRDKFWNDDYCEVVTTKNQAMREVLQKVQQVVGTQTSVLLTGETGTGKSLFARLIHAHSMRSDKPFISVHCGAIPENLVESELFGHEKGAFTGANRRKLGRFELANSGSIFLDEIGTISSAVQVKLLEVLQERYIQRIGGQTSIPVNVRIIAATNENLEDLCNSSLFRRDLYYRLNVFPIVLPPLRERKEDIFHLTSNFINKFSTLLNKNINSLSPEVMEAFLKYDWPGNVRELENVIERACILEQTDQLTPRSFSNNFFLNPEFQSELVNTCIPLGQARQVAVDAFERKYLTELLTETGGVIKKAAQVADISTRQLNKLMKKHAISRNTFSNKRN